MGIHYSTQATALGGRSGSVATADGRFRAELSAPQALGGDGGQGLNPEQLFAAAYAACFLSAIRSVAAREHIEVANDSNVTASVGICTNEGEEGFALSVTISADLPGISGTIADHVVRQAHEECTFSKATRGNIDVKLQCT